MCACEGFVTKTGDEFTPPSNETVETKMGLAEEKSGCGSQSETAYLSHI